VILGTTLKFITD